MSIRLNVRKLELLLAKLVSDALGNSQTTGGFYRIHREDDSLVERARIVVPIINEANDSILPGRVDLI